MFFKVDDLKLTLEITAPESRADLALLHNLKAIVPTLSRTLLKSLFHANKVCLLLNQSSVLDSQALTPSDLLPRGIHHLLIRDWKTFSETSLSKEAQASSQGCFLPIIYEDEDLLVLNKLTGVPSVPQSAIERDTAVGAALAHLPSLIEIAPHSFDPGLLHRLDTGTSGLLAFAKYSDEFERLRGLWKSGEVKKTYRALVRSKGMPGLKLPIHETFHITTPLGHDPKSDKRMVTYREYIKPRGAWLQAETWIENSLRISEGFFDLQIRITTGVMHQIRCHLASLGWPLMGDPVYGGTPSARLWLHAWKLTLPLKSGASLELQAKLPENWAASRVKI